MDTIINLMSGKNQKEKDNIKQEIKKYENINDEELLKLSISGINYIYGQIDRTIYFNPIKKHKLLGKLNNIIEKKKNLFNQQINNYQEVILKKNNDSSYLENGIEKKFDSEQYYNIDDYIIKYLGSLKNINLSESNYIFGKLYEFNFKSNSMNNPSDSITVYKLKETAGGRATRRKRSTKIKKTKKRHTKSKRQSKRTRR